MQCIDKIFKRKRCIPKWVGCSPGGVRRLRSGGSRSAQCEKEGELQPPTHSILTREHSIESKVQVRVSANVEFIAIFYAIIVRLTPLIEEEPELGDERSFNALQLKPSRRTSARRSWKNRRRHEGRLEMVIMQYAEECNAKAGRTQL